MFLLFIIDILINSDNFFMVVLYLLVGGINLIRNNIKNDNEMGRIMWIIYLIMNIVDFFLLILIIFYY